MVRGFGGVGLEGAFVFLLASIVAGCSGKSEGSGDDGDEGGGTGGTGAGGTGASGAGGTTGGTTGGGGTGGSPRPPQLGLYLLIRNPDPSTAEVAGRQCPSSTGVEWDIGAPILMNGMLVDVDSPSPTDFGSTLADGEGDTDIECTVTPSGMITATGGGTDPQITPPNGLVNFTLAATASLRGGVNVTGFSLYTPITFNIATASDLPPCTMSAVHEVAPGAFWGDIACPALADPARPDVACSASGTIVVEYCSTQ